MGDMDLAEKMIIAAKKVERNIVNFGLGRKKFKTWSGPRWRRDLY